jgi:hypothetical protein
MPGSGTSPGQSTRHRIHLSGRGTGSKFVLREISEISPWILASAAILAAFFVAWFAGILLSFRHEPGFTGRARTLQFFEPGSVFWGVAVLVALTLRELGRRFDPVPTDTSSETTPGATARKARLVEVLPVGLLVAAAGVCLSAVVGILVELTNFGNGIDTSFSGLFTYLAVLGLGGAAMWWAYRQTAKPLA